MFRMLILTTAILFGLNGAVQAQTEKKAKGTTIEIDLSKLPPELAKQLLQATQEKTKGKKTSKKREAPKGAANAISLSEAVAAAEKASKGKATSASRKDGPDYTNFNVDITMSDGERIRYTLSATGAVLQQRKGERD